jgi:hypothetical protein
MGNFDEMDSTEGDNVSMATSTCGVSRASSLPPDYQAVKKEIRHITDPAKMRSYILEHDVELMAYSTAILNSWLNIPDHKFHRNHQILSLKKQTESRCRSVNKLSEEVDVIKRDIEELRQLLASVFQSLKIRV